MKLTVKQRGSFRKIENFFEKMLNGDLYSTLDQYGQLGVDALAAATPKDSGVTAASWSYFVDISGGRSSITWTNDHFAGTTPVVIMLQYGHGTGTGGYVQGYDFINPAMVDIFDKISEGVWKAVVNA